MVVRLENLVLAEPVHCAQVYFMESWLLTAILRLVPAAVKIVFTGDPLQLTSSDCPAWQSAEYTQILAGGCGVAVLTQNLRSDDPRIEAVLDVANSGRLEGSPEHHLLCKRTVPPEGAVVLTANKKVAARICEADLEGKQTVKITAEWGRVVGRVLRQPPPFLAAVGMKVTLSRTVTDTDGRPVHTGTVGTVISVTDIREPTAKNAAVKVRLCDGRILDVAGITSDVYADDGKKLGKLTEIPLKHAAAQTVWAVQARFRPPLATARVCDGRPFFGFGFFWER